MRPSTFQSREQSMRERIGNLSRRGILKLFGVSAGASLLGQAALPANLQGQGAKVTPRKNVRHVIFIQNCGAMSPHETLDYQETKFTAKDLDMQKINSDFM